MATHPVPAPTGRDYQRWTIEDWITEAIDQYAQSSALMEAWKDIVVGSAAETMTYKQAANSAQRSTAAASIAAAKLGWDMTDG